MVRTPTILTAQRKDRDVGTSKARRIAEGLEFHYTRLPPPFTHQMGGQSTSPRLPKRSVQMM